MANYLDLLRARAGKLWLGLKGKIVGDVPPDYAVCEFGCRKTRCRYAEWKDCKNRLSYLEQKGNSDLPALGTTLIGPRIGAPYPFSRRRMRD